MTPELWKHAKEVFGAALERAPADRETFIAAACAHDTELRGEIVRLLARHDDARSFLERPAAAEADLPVHEPTGQRIGPFRILDVLGEGGMGTVYLAEQESPRRTVALKVIRAGAASDGLIRRFELEAAALARLQHPGIAQIYQAGTAEEGTRRRPYFAMELVRGTPLTEHARARKLGTRDRVALMIRVADAVQHAHVKGVVHRDLKPANILITDAGDPKILDFGVARLADAEARVTTMQTGVGQLVGTVPYMSPEQVGGDPQAVDTRSDVYALGVILFELLAGRLPYDLDNRSVPEAVRLILDAPPLRLSSLVRTLRGDLDTIAAKALEKDRQRRYQTASDLAGDLRRYLAREPILARPHSTFYQLRTFARRNKVLVAGVAGVFLALIAGIVTTTWQAVVAHRERQRAQAFLDSAAAAAANLSNFPSDVLANIAGATRARESMTSSGLKYAQALAAGRPFADDIQHQLAYAHQRVGEVHVALGRTAGALESFRHSLDIREALALARPDEASDERALAVGHWMITEALLPMGRIEEAHHHNEHALAILRTVVERRTGTADPGVDPLDSWWGYLAIGYRRMGDSHAASGDLSGALDSYTRGVELTEQFTPLPTENVGNGRIGAAALLGKARVLALLNRPEEALGVLGFTHQVLDELARQSGPTNVWERTKKARCHLVAVRALMALDRSAEAWREAGAALELAESLSVADPDHYPSRHLLAECLIELGAATRQTGDAAGALDHPRRSVAILESLARIDPDNAAVRADLARAAMALGGPP